MLWANAEVSRKPKSRSLTPQKARGFGMTGWKLCAEGRMSTRPPDAEEREGSGRPSKARRCVATNTEEDSMENVRLSSRQLISLYGNSNRMWKSTVRLCARMQPAWPVMPKTFCASERRAAHPLQKAQREGHPGRLVVWLRGTISESVFLRPTVKNEKG